MESTFENGKKSSMRISLYWIVAMSGAMVMSVCSAIILQAATKQIIDWSGIALAIGAIGLFMAPAFGFKAWQRKLEKN